MILNKYIYIILLFKMGFSAFYFNPENISLSNASAISYNDFRSSNAAVTSSHKGLSIKIIGLNMGFDNNFFSISKYNDINGKNFDDSTDPDYYPKSEFDELINKGLQFNLNSAFNIPFSDIVFNNISFHNRLYSIGNFGLPKSFVKLILYGNEANEVYNLDGNSTINIFSESSIGYSQKINNLSYGIRLKYLQGLAYGELLNLSDNSSYFVTDTTTGFMGQAKYLINQAIGGSGFAMDLGLIYNKSSDLTYGISLNNLFGTIYWDDDNITYNSLRDFIEEKLPLRHNEKQYYTILLDTLNAMNIVTTSLDQIYSTESFAVVEFDDLSNIPFNIDSLFNSGSLIQTENASYLLKTQDLSIEDINSFNLKKQVHVTDYPASLNISIKKDFEDNISLCTSLSTSFSNAIRNSERWKLSSGFIFNRFRNIPITFGFSISEKGRINSGFSMGYKAGPVLFNYGLNFKDAIFLQSAKGIDFSLSLIFKTHKI
tara:strand:- start:6223 stop:7680 length:1458 start_codon:yes stop_codon:yes gene_type:complete